MAAQELVSVAAAAGGGEVYRCRVCRAVLFETSDVSHGCGERCPTLNLEEPMVWMGALKGASGKLACGGRSGKPCGAKLGAWSWTGAPCACGEWVAPAFGVAKSRVDARPRAEAVAPRAAASALLGVSLQWLRASPPPAAVIFVAHGDDADGAREAIAKRWGGRLEAEAGAAWLFVSGAADPKTVARLVFEVSDRGVPLPKVALGGCGRGAAVAATAAAAAAAVGARVGRGFYLAPDRGGAAAFPAPALVCAAAADARAFPGLAVERYPGLEAEDLPAGVVRALCGYLTADDPPDDAGA